MRVDQLTPGDIVEHAGERATFVQQAEHPIWTGLRLVVWKMADGEWSHDALDAQQDVGQVVGDPDDRLDNLREALLHPSQR